MVENDASLRYPWGRKKDSDHNPSVSGDSEAEILIAMETVDVTIEKTVRGFVLCKG